MHSQTDRKHRSIHFGNVQPHHWDGSFTCETHQSMWMWMRHIVCKTLPIFHIYKIIFSICNGQNYGSNSQPVSRMLVCSEGRLLETD